MNPYRIVTGDKAVIRNEVMARRAVLAAQVSAEDIAALNDAIFAYVSAFPVQEVAGYMPIGSECQIAPVLASLHHAGYHLSLPVVTQRFAPLTFRRWKPGDLLQSGPHGVAHPNAGQPTVYPTLLLVPLLAYDDRGYRIGYGGGYYDRTLVALRQEHPTIHAVGIAYAGQRIPAIPADAFDERLDAVITEQGTEHFTRAYADAACES